MHEPMAANSPGAPVAGGMVSSFASEPFNEDQDRENLQTGAGFLHFAPTIRKPSPTYCISRQIGNIALREPLRPAVAPGWRWTFSKGPVEAGKPGRPFS
jgi:hypothetical protein